MKTKICIGWLFACVAAYPQAPATGFYGKLLNSVVNGISTQTYIAVSPDHKMTGTIDGGTGGIGGEYVWFFNDLAPDNVLGFYNNYPNPDDLTTFPGSTRKITLFDDTNPIQQIYLKQEGNVLYYTGLEMLGFALNYSTDNARVGPFPMAFPTINSDNLAGTYTYGDTEGTFTGVINNVHFVWGFMYLGDVGFGTDNQQATRLTSVQTISLSNGDTANAGSIVITTSYYYGAADLFPPFIATNTVIDVPFLSLEQEVNLNMVAIPMVLENPSVDRPQISIWPNPVTDVLNFDTGGTINDVTVSDINGRIVASGFSGSAVNLGTLQKGVYFARVETDSGQFTKKIIKQ